MTAKKAAKKAVPKATTQTQVLRDLLKARGGVTSDAAKAKGIKSPSTIVSNLKKQGMKIRTDMVMGKNGRFVARWSVA